MSNPDLSGKNILVAPLNWGLGHATRSMPVINVLLEWGANVILAGDGRSLHLLRKEYSGLQSVELPSYKVRYTSGPGMVAITLLRVPVYLSAVFREHRKLEQLVEELQLDMVISDNRYGIWSARVPSVFICHQLAIIPPQSIDWMTPYVHQLHRRFYRNFDQVWVPDFEGDGNLTGRLTHRYPLTEHSRFTGPLSRFKNKSPSTDPEYVAKFIVVLSGPEPQRTLLEDKILEQARSIEGDFIIVQGKTESFQVERQDNLRLISYLTADQLFDTMSNCDVVISRSGYSTVMDLCFLGKKAVFIPTPGQTEQVYLGEKLQAQNMAVVCDQDALDLKEALKRVESIKGFPKMESNDTLHDVMAEFVRQL
ncbi:MAG: UDP-N-acetylglucosamine--N-acetylmuramyl-(pentapeptide) pyrophosphoryl-undecaprenol N-acetylglucosamine transferase [Bacteroidetes bacterium]|nr:UDP-N-acetylglucosamine--N-acetylmuramyl-(pentapeptide) pyrophosphoryl-undecaprenol N-acetylglucosamine transferase [Bacteroidota bacterium]